MWEYMAVSEVEKVASDAVVVVMEAEAGVGIVSQHRGFFVAAALLLALVVGLLVYVL